MLLTMENFSSLNTPQLARQLLGCLLVRQIGKKIIKATITETEAYQGINDGASHARHGKTKRNWPMFGLPGYWYIYFVYGNHHMLNLVTGPDGYPAAVLIRAARLDDNKNLNGPGKLTKFLAIDRSLNGKPANQSSGLWLEERNIKINSRSIFASPRIGVNYAPPKWRDKPWRFTLKNQQ